MKGLDLTGMRFGRLVAIAPLHTLKRGRLWFCRCDCGNYLTLATGNLTTGNSSSCGCYRRDYVTAKNFRHGLLCRGKQSPEFYAFLNARKRCEDSKNKAFKDYGGRGIKFLLGSFDEMMAEVGHRPTPKHSLDRINNNGHYQVGNLRWATKLEQVHNSRRYQK